MRGIQKGMEREFMNLDTQVQLRTPQEFPQRDMDGANLMPLT